MKMFHSYVESKEGEKKMPIWGQPIVFRKSSGFLKDSLRKKKVKLTSNHAGLNSAVSVFGKDPAAFFFLKL
jgi:hypothetical protein